MNTPTIVVLAQRVITHNMSGFMIMMAYQPTQLTIKALRAFPKDANVHIDISDETGDYTTGAKWQIDKCDISDDQKTIVLVIRT